MTLKDQGGISHRTPSGSRGDSTGSARPPKDEAGLARRPLHTHLPSPQKYGLLWAEKSTRAYLDGMA